MEVLHLPWPLQDRHTWRTPGRSDWSLGWDQRIGFEEDLGLTHLLARPDVQFDILIEFEAFLVQEPHDLLLQDITFLAPEMM